MPVVIFAIIDRFPFEVVPRRTNIDLVMDRDTGAELCNSAPLIKMVASLSSKLVWLVVPIGLESGLAKEQSLGCDCLDNDFHRVGCSIDFSL